MSHSDPLARTRRSRRPPCSLIARRLQQRRRDADDGRLDGRRRVLPHRGDRPQRRRRRRSTWSRWCRRARRRTSTNPRRSSSPSSPRPTSCSTSARTSSRTWRRRSSRCPTRCSKVDLLDGLDLLPDHVAAARHRRHDDTERPTTRSTRADGSDDPHVWLDPANMRIMTATVVADARGGRAPTDAADASRRTPPTYDRRARRARRRRSPPASRECDSDGAGHGAPRVRLPRRRVRAHRRSRSPASRPARSRRRKTLEAIAEFAAANDVTTIFFEENLPDDLARTLADEIGAATGGARHARVAVERSARRRRRLRVGDATRTWRRCAPGSAASERLGPRSSRSRPRRALRRHRGAARRVVLGRRAVS